MFCFGFYSFAYRYLYLISQAITQEEHQEPNQNAQAEESHSVPTSSHLPNPEQMHVQDVLPSQTTRRESGEAAEKKISFENLADESAYPRFLVHWCLF
jgi:hypothetical protein